MNDIVYKYKDSGLERFRYLMFFLIWPFGTLLATMRNMKKSNFIFIYVLFCILFCWNLDVRNHLRYDDLSGIAGIFMANDITTSDFLDILYKYVTGHEDATRELYLYFMIWITRLFSDNPHTFFALCSIPYLFFQVKCFKIIIDNPKFHNGIIGVLTIFLFMLPRDIITVQNPRFTTALWLCIYVIMKYFSNSKENRKVLLWLLLTPLIHSSYWLFIVFFIFGLFAKYFQNILMPMVYLSLPFSYMSAEILGTLDITSIIPLPDSLNDWVLSYIQRTPEVSSTGGTGFYWVPIFFNFIKTTAYLLVPFYVWKKRHDLNSNPHTKNLFSFYLYFFAMVNFIQVIPVLGARYQWFIQILSIYMLFLAYGLNAKKILYIILFANAWFIFSRYFHGGAVSSSVPPIIFYTPAPYIVAHYWGIERMNINTSLDLFYH